MIPKHNVVPNINMLNMNPDRQWMYRRLTLGRLNQDFVDGLLRFLDFASSQHQCMDGNKIRCPCNGRKCQNRLYHDLDIVKFHVAKYGVALDYYVWECHGEARVEVTNNQTTINLEMGNVNTSITYHDTVFDAAGLDFTLLEELEEPPNSETKIFYDMLSAADKELWPRCEGHTLLSHVA